MLKDEKEYQASISFLHHTFYFLLLDGSSNVDVFFFCINSVLLYCSFFLSLVLNVCSYVAHLSLCLLSSIESETYTHVISLRAFSSAFWTRNFLLLLFFVNIGFARQFNPFAERRFHDKVKSLNSRKRLRENEDRVHSVSHPFILVCVCFFFWTIYKCMNIKRQYHADNKVEIYMKSICLNTYEFMYGALFSYIKRKARYHHCILSRNERIVGCLNSTLEIDAIMLSLYIGWEQPTTTFRTN